MASLSRRAAPHPPSSCSPPTLFVAAGPSTGPAPHVAYDPSFQMKTQFYLHAARFVLPLVVASGVPPGPHSARVKVRYQACREDLCLPPATLTLTAPVRVVAPR